MRLLQDLKVDKGMKADFTSPEGIKVTVENNSAGWVHVRCLRIYKRGRRAANQKPIEPKVE